MIAFFSSEDSEEDKFFVDLPFNSVVMVNSSSSSSEKMTSPKLNVEFSRTSGADSSWSTLYLYDAVSAVFRRKRVEVRRTDEVE